MAAEDNCPRTGELCLPRAAFTHMADGWDKEIAAYDAKKSELPTKLSRGFKRLVGRGELVDKTDQHIQNRRERVEYVRSLLVLNCAEHLCTVEDAMLASLTGTGEASLRAQHNPILKNSEQSTNLNPREEPYGK
jgi:hypothetical protein